MLTLQPVYGKRLSCALSMRKMIYLHHLSFLYFIEIYYIIYELDFVFLQIIKYSYILHLLYKYFLLLINYYLCIILFL